MAKEPPPQQLDLSKIDLPSDRITLGKIRRVEPEGFEPYTSSEHISPDNIIATVATEILLAKAAYAKARRIDPKEPVDAGERREYILNLNEDYCLYGISTGVKQTTEMIRGMERAAAEQAKQSTR
jgi:hypothetical protein